MVVQQTIVALKSWAAVIHHRHITSDFSAFLAVAVVLAYLHVLQNRDLVELGSDGGKMLLDFGDDLILVDHDDDAMLYTGVVVVLTLSWRMS
jgi:hypothetical protein